MRPWFLLFAVSTAHADGVVTTVRCGIEHDTFFNATVDQSPDGFGPLGIAFIGYHMDRITGGVQLGLEQFASAAFHDDLTATDFSDRYRFFSASARLEVELVPAWLIVGGAIGPAYGSALSGRRFEIGIGSRIVQSGDDALRVDLAYSHIGLSYGSFDEITMGSIATTIGWDHRF